MIHKNNRHYISEYFDLSQKFNAGDIIEFEMPPFVSGDYYASIYFDDDGDPYIDMKCNYFPNCRDYYVVSQQ